MDAECDDLNGLAENNVEGLINNGSDETLAQESKGNPSLPANDCNNSIEEQANESDANKTTGCSQSKSNKTENSSEVARNSEQVYENGKRKIKEEKPPTKVVVRRLPPLMTKEIFLEQVSPLPPYDYMYFVSGDPSYGIHSFSRAYLNFINQEDVFTFTRTFDNYVFIDGKGQEYPAVVEFSPFQRVPKQRSKKKDTLTGTIESDPMYISFKENLLAEALENSKPGAKTMKQHYFETEISTTEEVGTTPLLEFLKQRRAEKARIRDERREEKKRKEAERKLKQKAKEKKEVIEEEETKDIKIHHCTVSAEKSFNKGEFTLLLKSEKEKVAEKIVTSDKKEINHTGKMLNATESNINNGKLVIKKRNERINVDLSTKTLENNSRDTNNFGKSINSNSNTECNFNKQSNNVSRNDYEENKTSTKEQNISQLRNLNNNCGWKKAEMQTQYLRKILGLSTQENNTSSDVDTRKVTVSNKNDVQSNERIFSSESEINRKKYEPEVLFSERTLWCDDSNINPALPSASFKTSNNLLNNNKNEKDKKNNLHDECKINKNKKGNFNTESGKVNRPFRGEIVIDKALSTNNVLPSAFRKTATKDSK